MNAQRYQAKADAYDAARAAAHAARSAKMAANDARAAAINGDARAKANAKSATVDANEAVAYAEHAAHAADAVDIFNAKKQASAAADAAANAAYYAANAKRAAAAVANAVPVPQSAVVEAAAIHTDKPTTAELADDGEATKTVGANDAHYKAACSLIKNFGMILDRKTRQEMYEPYCEELKEDFLEYDGPKWWQRLCFWTRVGSVAIECLIRSQLGRVVAVIAGAWAVIEKLIWS